ncbi:hypothetical protein JTE90_017362 [Oedothorax gibbosus]|uniref:Tetratricopeptide SHNi-TPR domain-containing protein n=1 Tax=Oedothorax gibbosus TaxID=931172 RepID=A0AAV6VRU7_9ARAC|nr:hypothetical protein JTE90_017362 [Oedothorax gibbosus]
MGDSTDVKAENSVPTEETASGSKDLSKTLPEEAFNNFLQGKRHIVVQDYKFAVQSLSTACEMYTQHFGEMALECGEVHFLYGKALFRLSQQNAGVFGGALNEDVTETEDDESGKASDEDSKENESDKNDADTENGEENGEDGDEAEEKEPSESTDSPQAVVAEETSKEPTEAEQADSKEETEQADNKEADTSTALDESKVESEQQPEQEEEELDDLELAWNSLETAKSIFLRQGENDVEAQLKVAEILQLLAEISMESDNNVAAINDLKECLVIKRRHLKPDDRLLAETFYQMGLAQLLEKMYNDALENFSTTMSILQLRIDNLKATPVADTVGNFESADRDKEVEDLEGVLADIREKVEDTRELIKDAERVLKEEIEKRYPLPAEETGFPGAEQKAETNNKPVTNITHLLKRKKPEQDEEKDRELKRPKLTSAVANGNSKISE